MQNRTDAGQEDAGHDGCRGRMQDRVDAGQGGCRTEKMQDRTYAGQEG